MKRILTVGIAIALFLSAGYAQKKAYVFKGKVEKIDLANKSFVVNGEEVKGWMGAMTMSYAADKDDVLKKLKVGDQITAKVYDDDFKVLHDVQVVAAKPAETNVTKGTKAAPAAKDAKKAPAKK